MPLGVLACWGVSEALQSDTGEMDVQHAKVLPHRTHSRAHMVTAVTLEQCAAFNGEHAFRLIFIFSA